jgi:hypothetical protein
MHVFIFHLQRWGYHGNDPQPVALWRMRLLTFSILVASTGADVQGTVGWCGDVAPFKSNLNMVFMPNEEAHNLRWAITRVPKRRQPRNGGSHPPRMAHLWSESDTNPDRVVRAHVRCRV